MMAVLLPGLQHRHLGLADQLVGGIPTLPVSSDGHSDRDVQGQWLLLPIYPLSINQVA